VANVPQLCAALCCACGKVAYSCCYAPFFFVLLFRMKINTTKVVK
jgi:hypothetical protein